MKLKALKVANTRLQSIKKGSSSFQKQRHCIDEHIKEERPTCAPSHVWWIYIMVVPNSLVQPPQLTIGFKTVMSWYQCSGRVLCPWRHLCCFQWPDVVFCTRLRQQRWMISAGFSSSVFISQCPFLQKCSSPSTWRGFWQTTFLYLMKLPWNILCRTTPNLKPASSAGVRGIVSECDEANNNVEELRPVDPHGFVGISHSAFCNILATH